MIKGILGDLTDEAKIDSFFKILASNINRNFIAKKKQTIYIDFHLHQ
jgi:hypothetical protein